MKKQKLWFEKLVKIPLLILYFILLIVHFIIKDRIHYISVLYYACPLPIIMLFGLMVTVLFIKKKAIFYFLSLILLSTSLFFGFHNFGSEFDQTLSNEPSHILFWNAAKNQPLPTSILIAHIKSSKPEIIALVEAFEVSNKDLNILRKNCPEYQFKRLEGEMLVGIKGKIIRTEFKSEDDVYKFNFVSAEINQKNMSLLIADVYAGPVLNKQIPLKIISNATQDYNVDILVGDFNTPYESVFFDYFKTNYHSFHPYSVGMTSTWPVPFPIMEIDQIWIKKSLQPIKMNKFSYPISDHKLLIGEYK